jgi:hypothetical protein
VSPRRRIAHMTRSWIVACAAALTAAVAATPAAAVKPVSVPYREDFMAVAYSEGRVLVAEPAPTGAKALVVREVRLSDRTKTVLATIAFHEDQPEVSLAANGTGYLIAIRDDRPGSDRIILGGYDGSQRTLVDCAPASAADDSPSLSVAAGTTGFAFAGARCGPAGIATVAADGTLTPVGGEGPGPVSYGLSYAEPYLAVPLSNTVRVIDVTTGAERRLPPGYGGDATPVAVLADGTLVFDTGTPDTVAAGLYVWPAGAATPTFRSDRGSHNDVVAAGGLVVFDTISAPRVVSLGGGIARSVGAPGVGLPGGLLGFDGTRVAIQSFSCRGERQVSVIGVGETRTPGSVYGCPVRFGQGPARFGPSGRAPVRVRCRNGCRADLRLVEQSTERRPCDALDPTGERKCRILATARLDLPASKRARRVTFTLTDAGRRVRRSTSSVEVSTSFRGNFGLSASTEIRTAVLS